MQKLKISAFFLIFLVISVLCAENPKESMISINRFPQNSDVFDDYLIQTQTKAILDPKINGILYPVIGFPAMVTPDEPCFSVIFRFIPDPGIGTNPSIEYLKIVRSDESGTTEFLNFGGETVKRFDVKIINADANIAKISVCGIVLPEAKYDIVLKQSYQNEMISRNAVFFPHYEESDPTKFLIVADPQIEDLLSKKTDDMNFNPENYPFYAENSLLNYDQQFGIIKAIFSQLNSADTNFSVMLGDIAYGRDFQEEYSDFYDLMTNLEIPMFSIPGNHDGYAHFTKVNDLTTPLEWDGLEYWAKFLGPKNNAFNFRNKTYLLLNTYDGTPQRRACAQIGIGDTGASPVANWGGYLAEKTLNWAETVLEHNDVAAVFGHMMPLGQDGTGVYHENRAFSRIYGVISVIDEQEWNIDSSSWDSDLTDGIFNETQTSNNGVSLTSFLAKKAKPPIYFSGHTHLDKIFTFEKGAELIPNTGVIAPDKMEFIMTTTMATSGSGDYWGFRRVEMSDEEVSYNYTCERYENCGFDKSIHGMQSVPAGNLWVSYSWQHGSENKESIFAGGDGAAIKVTAEIVNYLPTEENVTLRFIMPKAQYGYKLDNENFRIVDAAASSDPSNTVIIIAKGKIAAGSELDAFYNKNFTKFTDYVTISPAEEWEVPVPEIEYSHYVEYNREEVTVPASAKVLNADKFASLIWQRKDDWSDKIFDFAYGESFEDENIAFCINDFNFYLRYTTRNGASGISSFYVECRVKEDPWTDDDCCAETDDDDYQPDEEIPETGSDEDNEPDESEEPDEDSEETTEKKSSSGCSAIIL